ncbi:MAG: DUF3662 and FHA domain-containing protein [Cryobacterium sp.]|nr:DUF3662 and FHA domain-containing protein [Cryobacterium sp.]MCC7127800.1 DUF3662 and FHA domain-containing protein [Microbacteriaceae bacterium]MCO5294987.1 DUF3662 and FHA domain-containing protein [Homoserinimonas sp.]
MGLLDRFEKGLERVVNGTFAKTFRSELEPVEITAALRRELDTKAAVVARDRVLVPNKFVVDLSPSDFKRMSQLGPSLIDELTQLVQTHATAQHYRFAGGIEIKLRSSESLSEGMLEIESSNVKGEIAWTPVLDVDGKRYPIRRGHTILGRGAEADITIDDPGISRKHVEILWDGRRAQVNDLGSTNGTELDGRPVRKAALESDSIISIGKTRIIFRVLAQSANVARLAEQGFDGENYGDS